MRGHKRRNRRDLHHLMAQGYWMHALQQGASAAAGSRIVLHQLVNALNQQQLQASAGIARMVAALEATAFTPRQGGLKPGLSQEGDLKELRELRSIRSRSSGQFGRQGSELGAEMIVLLSQSPSALRCVKMNF